MAARTPDAARVTGLLLVVMAVAAGFAEVGVRAALIVPEDAAATARNVLSAEPLFRKGLVGSLIAFLLDIPVSVLLYVLLRPVDRTLALLSTAFRLVYTAVVGANLIHYLGTLLILQDAAVQAVFAPRQVQALALLFMNLYKHGFSLALVFFGLHLVLLGILLCRARAFPKVLGALVVSAGCAYLLDGSTLFLAPAVNARIAKLLAIPATFEILLAIWLLVKGARAFAPPGEAAPIAG